MPESRAERSLTLDELNDNLTKKLNKILNLLEKQQPYSSLLHTHSLDFKQPQFDYQSVIKRSEDRFNQIQNLLSSHEDKK